MSIYMSVFPQRQCVCQSPSIVDLRSNALPSFLRATPFPCPPPRTFHRPSLSRFLLSSSPLTASPNKSGLPRLPDPNLPSAVLLRRPAASDGVGDAFLGGCLLLRRGCPLRPRGPPRRPLRHRCHHRHRRQAGPSHLIRHLLGRRSLGHLHRRHHHVEEPAEAPVREPAEQDVPGLLHAHLCLRRHLRRRVRVPPPVEDGIGRRALPAWVPALRAWLQPLQPAGLHSHDHRVFFLRDVTAL